jgi:hypothetical protein
MQRFGSKSASLLWFFIGYWILKRGWISIRPLIFLGKEVERVKELD